MNALVPELKARGVEAIVVLIHEGGFPTGDYNECPGISGPIVDIVKKFDKAVDVVISGHTHRAYVCEIDGRLVTSGDKYGTLVTAIDLKLDPATRDVVSARADNVIVRTDTLGEGSGADRAARSLRQGCRPDRQPPGGLDHAKRCRACPTMPARARSAISSPMPSWPRPRRGRWRRRDRLHQSRRHPHRYPAKGGRRGDLCRRVRQPAVPQPAGHADADGNADQGHAGAAMARSEAAADSAGLEVAFPMPGTAPSPMASA